MFPESAPTIDGGDGGVAGVGAVGGGATGGAGGSTTGGDGGTIAGGTGGTIAGGTGGTTSGGTGGTMTGGTGGTTTGGTGGTMTGGTGGTTTGGTGGTTAGGSGGTGGTTGSGIHCSNTSCNPPTQVCCFEIATSTGVCVAAGTCANSTIACDDSADCGGTYCCARYTSGGILTGSSCVATATNCSPRGSQTVELWCDPAAGTGCPGTQTCAGTSAVGGYKKCM